MIRIEAFDIGNNFVLVFDADAMSPASLALQADSLLLIHQGSTDITIIILNVNGLNATTKRHRLATG